MSCPACGSLLGFLAVGGDSRFFTHQSGCGAPGGDWNGDGLGLWAPADAGESAAGRISDEPHHAVAKTAAPAGRLQNLGALVIGTRIITVR